MFAQKKIDPSVPASMPNRRWNQYAAKLWTTKPPPKESSAKSAESLNTDVARSVHAGQARGRPGRRARCPVAVDSAAR